MSEAKKQIIDKLVGKQMAIPADARKRIVGAAKKLWEFQDVNVPDDALITFGTNGAWVAAKVWVSAQDFVEAK